MRIHVVGNLCRDTTLAVSRFPMPGETIVAIESRVGLGGKGLNQAVAAARTGAAVNLYAAVGQGEADIVASTLADEPGLDLQLVEEAAPTDTSTILVRPDGENLIVSSGAAARAFNPLSRHGVTDGIAPGDILLMQGNLIGAATQACLRDGRRRGALTVWNASPLPEDGAPDWRNIDLLIVNRGEVSALGGAGNPEAAARALIASGVGAVAVTMGGEGVTYVEAHVRIAVAASAVSVRDTSGAGDVFCGVLVGLTAHGTVRGAALAWATAAASLSVTRSGALAACPSASEIAALAPTCQIRSTP